MHGNNIKHFTSQTHTYTYKIIRCVYGDKKPQWEKTLLDLA